MKLLDNENYISVEIFKMLQDRIQNGTDSADEEVQLVADLLRYNTLLSVARAGTGHLGASLSIMELLAEIYFRKAAISLQNIEDKNRDIFILSKGHAAPGLYATLAAKGFIGNKDLERLRRLNGLQGHCDISTLGIEANTGSLAMGLSRAVGYAIAKKRFGYNGQVYVIVGDGELQEGQIWEALLSALSYQLSNLNVIVDMNKVQTDQFVSDIVRYEDIPKTLSSMGFNVYDGSAKTIEGIRTGFEYLDHNLTKPKAFIAHTIKGSGVEYMEHDNVLINREADRYIWHNKTPNSAELKKALDAIIERRSKQLEDLGVEFTLETEILNVSMEAIEVNIEGEKLTLGFSEELIALGKNSPLVVFDADLETDCGLSGFRDCYPERFFEMGIMEQHMVSTAAAFSRLGYIPVINSYSAFLTSRSNEQIYNLATENGRAIIVGHMAGVIPATPGKSHQAYRDISCMKNINGMQFYQPITACDCKNILNRFINDEVGKLIYLRLSMAASAIKLPTPPSDLEIGQPQIIKKGKDAILISCGPVLLGECFAASMELEKNNVHVEIWNHPWLSEFSEKYLAEAVERKIPIIIVEDHYKYGGMGESFYASAGKLGLSIEKTAHLAIQGFTTTGFRDEALRDFGLDRSSIQKAVEKLL